jgi:hypothetical protein
MRKDRKEYRISQEFPDGIPDRRIGDYYAFNGLPAAFANPRSIAAYSISQWMTPRFLTPCPLVITFPPRIQRWGVEFSFALPSNFIRGKRTHCSKRMREASKRTAWNTNPLPSHTRKNRRRRVANISRASRFSSSKPALKIWRRSPKLYARNSDTHQLLGRGIQTPINFSVGATRPEEFRRNLLKRRRSG